MNRRRSNHRLILIGIALGLIGASLYTLSRIHSMDLRFAQQAERRFSAGQYREAIAADQRLLERFHCWPTRLSAILFGARSGCH